MPLHVIWHIHAHLARREQFRARVKSNLCTYYNPGDRVWVQNNRTCMQSTKLEPLCVGHCEILDWLGSSGRNNKTALPNGVKKMCTWMTANHTFPHRTVKRYPASTGEVLIAIWHICKICCLRYPFPVHAFKYRNQQGFFSDYSYRCRFRPSCSPTPPPPGSCISFSRGLVNAAILGSETNVAHCHCYKTTADFHSPSHNCLIF